MDNASESDESGETSLTISIINLPKFSPNSNESHILCLRFLYQNPTVLSFSIFRSFAFIYLFILLLKYYFPLTEVYSYLPSSVFFILITPGYGR